MEKDAYKNKLTSLKRGYCSRNNKKKYAQRIDYNANSDIRNYKHFKAKKEFESALNDEIKKVDEVS
jgi:hypothetical protein